MNLFRQQAERRYLAIVVLGLALLISGIDRLVLSVLT